MRRDNERSIQQPRRRGRRFVAVVLALLLALPIVGGRPVEAQWAVIDAANLAAKKFDTIKRLVEIAQRAIQLYNEIVMIANQLRNLESFDVEGLLELGLEVLGLYERSLASIWTILGDGDTLTIAEPYLDQEFDRTFLGIAEPPRNGDWTYEDRRTNERLLRTARQILLASEESVGATMNTSGYRAAVADRSLGAAGNLQAIQASNMFLQGIGEELEAQGDQTALILNLLSVLAGDLISHRGRAQEQLHVFMTSPGGGGPLGAAPVVLPEGEP